ncbi:MAG: RagB/SusD family nutrient uptake outer membrane protein [Bacteroidota bacterium]
MKIKLIILASLFLMISGGCEKFLEPQSESEIVPKKIESLNELLLGEAYPRNNGRIFIETILGVLDDDVEYVAFVPEEELPQSNLRESTFACYSWQPDMFTTFRLFDYFSESYYNTWRNAYRGIMGCNAVLDYIDNVSGTEYEKNSVTGQALTLRGFYYFHLVNTYGQPYSYNKDALGVPLKLSSNLVIDGQPRNTVESIYNSILSDLTEAENALLKLEEADHWKPNYRISLPMVQLLLSRVYLFVEDWSNAAIYAEKVITNSNFSLIDLNNVPEGTEEKPYYNFLDYFNNPEVIWLYGQTQDAFYLSWIQSMTNALASSGKDKALFKASDALMSQYDNNDLRPELYIISDYPNGRYKIPMGKIKVNEQISPSNEAFGRSFRLAEAYLNAAEAYAMLNIQGEAADEAMLLINDLQSKRFASGTFVPLAGLTPEELLQEVRDERRRELCFEGHRWFDLRRYGMPSIYHKWYDETGLIIYTLQNNDPGYTLPIPDEALLKNRQLVQNPLASPRGAQ